jgi:hypothetical protein
VAVLRLEHPVALSTNCSPVIVAPHYSKSPPTRSVSRTKAMSRQEIPKRCHARDRLELKLQQRTPLTSANGRANQRRGGVDQDEKSGQERVGVQTRAWFLSEYAEFEEFL